jgi:hypothetical protein
LLENKIQENKNRCWEIGPSLTGIGYLKGRLGLSSLKRIYSGNYISKVKGDYILYYCSAFCILYSVLLMYYSCIMYLCTILPLGIGPIAIANKYNNNIINIAGVIFLKSNGGRISFSYFLSFAYFLCVFVNICPS